MSNRDQIRPYDNPIPKHWTEYLNLQYFCILVGSLIVLEESMHIGHKVNDLKASLNFEDNEADFISYRDFPIILSLRIPGLIAAVFLVFGARKVCKSIFYFIFSLIFLSTVIVLIY